MDNMMGGLCTWIKVVDEVVQGAGVGEESANKVKLWDIQVAALSCLLL